MPILTQRPRRSYALLALACLAGLGFGLYLQHAVGLNPCPMCIVQRYALLLVALGAAAAAASQRLWAWRLGAAWVLASAGFGALTAARQSWLQWYPPATASCGRDFYGLIESFPLQRAIPLIFKGSGDCAAVDWTFLGGTLANWSFVVFSVWLAFGLTMLWGLRGQRS